MDCSGVLGYRERLEVIEIGHVANAGPAEMHESGNISWFSSGVV